MKIFRREYLFALVVGPADGILTSLTLTAGRLLAPGEPITMPLAIRIALAASLSGGFVFFVAEYARLRGDLTHAEQHLNLSEKGKLAASRLGQDVFRKSLRGSAITAAAGFAGALLPLALGALFPTISWVTIAIAILILGLLGAGISREVSGNPIYWATGLMAGGALLTAAGVFLHVA